jgi:hypothetical protein
MEAILVLERMESMILSVSPSIIQSQQRIKSRHKKFTSLIVTQLKDNIKVLLHYSQKKTPS